MYLYGASGHGKVIKEILEAQGRSVDGFIDDDESINEQSNLPVIHSAEKTDEVIVSIGVNETRKTIADKLHCKKAKLRFILLPLSRIVQKSEKVVS